MIWMQGYELNRIANPTHQRATLLRDPNRKQALTLEINRFPVQSRVAVNLLPLERQQLAKGFQCRLTLSFFQ